MEHLVSQFPNKHIAIVESEKTALIMAIEEPDYLWIASGGLSNLTHKRMQVYKNRKVVFYLDLETYEKWSDKAEKLNESDFTIKSSKLLEEKATLTDKTEGYDISDYFVQSRLQKLQTNDNLAQMIN